MRGFVCTLCLPCYYGIPRVDAIAPRPALAIAWVIDNARLHGRATYITTVVPERRGRDVSAFSRLSLCLTFLVFNLCLDE